MKEIKIGGLTLTINDDIKIGCFVKDSVFGHEGRVTEFHHKVDLDVSWLTGLNLTDKEMDCARWASILTCTGGSVCLPDKQLTVIDIPDFTHPYDEFHGYGPQEPWVIVHYECPKCGERKHIHRDGCGRWDPDAQEWYFDDDYSEGDWCGACDSFCEGGFKEVEIEVPAH